MLPEKPSKHGSAYSSIATNRNKNEIRNVIVSTCVDRPSLWDVKDEWNIIILFMPLRLTVASIRSVTRGDWWAKEVDALCVVSVRKEVFQRVWVGFGTSIGLRALWKQFSSRDEYFSGGIGIKFLEAENSMGGFLLSNVPSWRWLLCRW